MHSRAKYLPHTCVQDQPVPPVFFQCQLHMEVLSIRCSSQTMSVQKAAMHVQPCFSHCSTGSDTDMAPLFSAELAVWDSSVITRHHSLVMTRSAEKKYRRSWNALPSRLLGHNRSAFMPTLVLLVQQQQKRICSQAPETCVFTRKTYLTSCAVLLNLDSLKVITITWLHDIQLKMHAKHAQPLVGKHFFATVLEVICEPRCTWFSTKIRLHS